MYIQAELVLKTYKPLHLEPGMFFVNIINKGTRKETTELFKLDKYPLNSEEFIKQNGYPVELYILAEDESILASPEEIGWWDAGEDTDELYDITLKELNTIIQDYDGVLMLDVDEIHTDDESDEYVEVFPIKYLDKVTLSYLHHIEEEEYDEEYEWDEDDIDDDTWKEID